MQTAIASSTRMTSLDPASERSSRSCNASPKACLTEKHVREHPRSCIVKLSSVFFCVFVGGGYLK